MSGFGGPGFTVLDATELGTVFVPVEGTSDLYGGSIVYSYHYGVEVMGAAAGHGDLTNFKVPYGIVIAGNNKTKVYGASTYGYAEKTTGVLTAALQLVRDWRGAEGQYGKGDPQALVRIALIGPTSRIRGRLFQGAYGTAPTLCTAASGVSTTGFTGNTITGTTIVFNNFCYCRSGANAGIYRVADGASATVWVFTKAWPKTIVVGDTFVFGPKQGANTLVQFDAASQYIDTNADATTANYRINVLRTNLEVAGEEYVDFMFNAVTFLPTLTA